MSGRTRPQRPPRQSAHRVGADDATTVIHPPQSSSPEPPALTAVGPSGVDGIPGRYDDGTEWLHSGLRRHQRISIIALVVVWTGAWISALAYNLGTVLSGNRPTASGEKSHNTVAALIALLGWFILWPSWVITKCLIAPLTASSHRRYGY